MTFVKTLQKLAFISALLLASSGVSAQYPGLSDPGAGTTTNGGGFLPVDAEVDGGTLPLGATSQVVIRFKNDSGQPIQTGFIRLYPSSTVSANVSMNQCEQEPLNPGAECAIALSVKGLQSGQWRVEMLMSHSGRARLVATTVSGQVEASTDGSQSLSNDIQSTPQAVDFGTLGDSQSLVQAVVLRNVTSTAIDVNDIYIDASEQSGFGLKTDCDSLAAGEACLAIINWSPRLEGRASGVLVIDHTGSAGLTSVSIKGEYNPDEVSEAEIYPRAVPGKGLLVSSRRELDFGDNVATASSMTISLVNAGDAPLRIKNVKVAGADNGLGFKEEGCAADMILQPVEACPLTIQWSPTRVGEVYDDVQIDHDGARGVLVLPVRGEAIAAVSQDQKSIVMSNRSGQTRIISSNDSSQAPADAGANSNLSADSAPPPPRPTATALSFPTIANPATVLDGYKITSFSAKRAIINGPGGSRIIFNNEEAVLGGVPWMIEIKPSGIEFNHQDQRVLLLFDRSLSSVARVTASDSSAASGGNGGN